MIKIYRIIDNTNGNIYIGKTKQKYLCDRLSSHKSLKDCSSREILKNEDYKIELIEETDDINRERYWILNTNCINKQIPGRTRKEYKEDNREEILQYQSEYRENNKKKAKEYKTEYNDYRKSWGGDMRSLECNLLKIDPNLFF
jgi:hypothetical protein